MCIVVEGSDHLGKTTLCKKLLEHPLLKQRGYVYHALSRLPDGFHRFWGYKALAQQRVVQDRFHMSEIAYAYARGDESTPLTPDRYRRVDATLRLLPAFTVVLTISPSLLRHRLEHEPKEEMYDNALILRANEVFRTIADTRIFVYNSAVYSDIDVDAQIHCDERSPYPTGLDALNIIDCYERRLTQWESDAEVRQLSLF